MLNSIGVGIATVVLGLLICAPAAFALVKLNLPGRSTIFSIVILSFLIPFDAIAIPLSTLFRDLGLENTYLGIILPGIGNGFAVFLLRQFFLGVLSELADAGRVDGLGWFGIFRIFRCFFESGSRPGIFSQNLPLAIPRSARPLAERFLREDPSKKFVVH
jgi:putative chitobiose transport system permease protein